MPARSDLRILVLTGDPHLPDPTKPGARYNPEDVANIAAMREAFTSLGRFRFAFLDEHPRLLDHLRADRPDLLVNFCDTGFANLAAQELHVPALCELLGVPCTGAPPACMAICFDKQVVRLLAEAMSIPTPRELLLAPDEPLPESPDLWPALIKPNQGDGSLGITKDAVVRSAAEARAYLDRLRHELPGRAVLIQEYLPGAEYGVGLIGNPAHGLTALPPLEVDYSGLPAGLDPILSYESKSLPDSPYWTDIRYREARADAAVIETITAASKRLFARLGCRDYARFDFRVGADGTPRLLEVNPNPAWANDAKLALMAGFAGIAYPRLLEMILEAALTRLGLPA